MKEPSYSLAEAAGLVGVHRNTLSKWISQGCPVEKRADRSRGRERRIHLPDIIDWLQDRAVQDAVGDTSKMNIDEATRLGRWEYGGASEEVGQFGGAHSARSGRLLPVYHQVILMS